MTPEMFTLLLASDHGLAPLNADQLDNAIGAAYMRQALRVTAVTALYRNIPIMEHSVRV